MPDIEDDSFDEENWGGIEDYDPTTPLTLDDFEEAWLKAELDDEDD